MRLLIKHFSAPTSFVKRLKEALEESFRIKPQADVPSIVIEAIHPPRLDGPSTAEDSSSCILLVVTQNDIEHGWLKTTLAEIGTGHRVLKAFAGRVDRDIVHEIAPEDGDVYFGETEASTRVAFLTLARSLGGGDPGLSHVQTLALQYETFDKQQLAETRTVELHDKIFKRLVGPETLLLLAQAGRDGRALHSLIEDHAKDHYGVSRVLRFTLPASLNISNVQLFNSLGEACGFGTTDQAEWQRALKTKAEEEGLVLVIITRFEHASHESQRLLSSTLRGTSEELEGGTLHFIVSGGKELARQKFVNGDHSFLNHAAAMILPDFEVPDLVEWAGAEISSSLLKEDLAAWLLKRYGGHPGLLRQALDVFRRKGGLGDQEMQEAILHEESDNCWFEHYFLPLTRDSNTVQQACRYLRAPEDLGRFSYWPADKTLRRLFWDNLVTRRKDGLLAWRSDSIVEAGLRILECKDA